MPSPALIVPVPVNRFPNKLAPNVLNEILENPPFKTFASILIVSLTHLINNLDSSSGLTTFMISCIFSLEIIIIVIRGVERGPDPNIFL